MLELTLLAGPGSTTVRSFATCLCSVMEIPAAHVPLPTGTLQEAMGQWRQWLAGRGFGLAELAKPQAFNWPGYWIALVRTESTEDSTAVLMFGTPAGVVLSPGAPNLAGTPLPGLDVVAGYAVAGRGLEGDRYAAKAGTFSSGAPTAKGYDLTLIEAEVLDELVLPDGSSLTYAAARRNIVTREEWRLPQRQLGLRIRRRRESRGSGVPHRSDRAREDPGGHRQVLSAGRDRRGAQVCRAGTQEGACGGFRREGGVVGWT